MHSGDLPQECLFFFAIQAFFNFFPIFTFPLVRVPLPSCFRPSPPVAGRLQSYVFTYMMGLAGFAYVFWPIVWIGLK